MSQFYNKYRRLFTEADQIHKNRSALINPSSPYTPSPPNQFLELSRRYDGGAKKKLARSPALDEFERSILPRLRTESDAVDKLPSLNLRYPQPHQLPKNYFQPQKPLKLISVREQEQRYANEALQHLKPYSKFNNNRNKQLIQDVPLREKHNAYAIREEMGALSQAGVTSLDQIKTKNERSVSEKMGLKPIQAPRAANKTPQSTKISIYESQLYGFNQNPYAFANSKLTDIKLIERFYPRGIVNQYKVCLLRRHQSKGELAERRERLRLLLEKDRIDFQLPPK